MRVFFDTSVLVAPLVEAHPLHVRALPWLDRAQGGEFDGAVSSHTLAELYAVTLVTLQKMSVPDSIPPELGP
jgi:predicted nucleic acid-binding protein